MKKLLLLLVLLGNLTFTGAQNPPQIVYFKSSKLDTSYQPSKQNTTQTSKQKKSRSNKSASRKTPCGNCTTVEDDCEKSEPQRNPCEIHFDNQGKLLPPLPTVIQIGEKLDVAIENPNLTEPTLYQKMINKLDENIWDKEPLNKFPDMNGFKKELTTQKGYGTKIGKNDYVIKPDAPIEFNKVGIFSVKLFQDNADAIFFKQQFGEINKNKKYKGWAEYKPTFESLYPIFMRYALKINQFRMELALLPPKNEPCNEQIEARRIQLEKIKCQYLNDSLPMVQKQIHQIALNVIADNKPWMQSWLWLTGGKPLLNPFGNTSVSERVRKIENDLASSEELLKFYQGLSDCCGQNPQQFINLLKTPISSVSTSIVQLKKAKDNIPQLQKNYDDWLVSMTETKKLLNHAKLFVSDCQQINWMSHYDASADYAKMNPNSLLPDFVYEEDGVQGLVHNLTATQKVSAKESVKEIKQRTELDVQTDAPFDALAEAMKFLDPTNLLAETLKVFTGAKAQVLGAGGQEKVKETITEKDKNPKYRDCCEQNEKLLDETFALATWLNAQTEPPIEDLQKKFDSFDKLEKADKLTPVYRTENVLVNESREAKGSNEIKYEIFEAGKDKAVAKDGYKTYNTVRWWPMVSTNYVFGSRAVSIYDNATGKFKTDTDIDNFEAVVGVKYYIKESNMTRTKKRSDFIKDNLDSRYNDSRGNGWCSKFYLLGGLGVRHRFLKNYFLGGGIDITPGFSVQAGGNLFFRKAYDLNNGQIEREFEIPSVRGFFGIAIDPNVVTKLIKLF